VPGFYVFSGPKLRDRRESLDMSREALAIAVDRSASGIALYETGYRTPSRAVLLQLAAALGVSPRELVDEDPVFAEAAL
jgi:transcriptional regulator with XRE-family HTH domain